MDTEELDMSWLEETRKIADAPPDPEQPMKKISQTSQTPQTPQTHIQINSIYVNSNQEIECTVKETHEMTTISPSYSSLSKEHVLKLIQQKKTPVVAPLQSTGKKYRLSEIIQYVVVCDDLKTYSLSTPITPVTPVTNKEFKKINHIDEIQIPPTFPLFHKINCIYFIYNENDSTIQQKKPPLKIEFPKQSSHIVKKTKKVRFDENDLDDTPKFTFQKWNHTKKATQTP
jgi:hypothetical protein